MSLPCPVLISHEAWSPSSWEHTVKPRPGLLLEWRNRPFTGGAARWEGLVVYAMGAPTGWLVQMEWVLGARLMPVRVVPEDGSVGKIDG